MFLILKKDLFGLFLIYIYNLQQIFLLLMSKINKERSGVLKLKRLCVFTLIFSLLFSNTLIGGINTLQSDDDTNAITVSTEINNAKTVIPGGKSIGVILSTKGVTISNVSSFIQIDGSECSPAKDSGLKNGDLIVKFNNKTICSIDDLCNAITESGDNAVSVSVLRNKKTINSLITPKKSQDEKKYKIGAWVKDAVSGIGTLTFYDPETKYFAALGHGIFIRETGDIPEIDGGQLHNATIVDVAKSTKGKPGELKGTFSTNNCVIGNITNNTQFGICGKITDKISVENQPVLLGKKSDIQTGKAYILSNIKDDIIEKFEIEILRIDDNSSSSSKNMIIKVTDPHLIERTGGIVQGMSGSPIIQNGRIVGAVTHVFVNDPTRGYGIFIENMLTEAKN